MDTPGAPRSGLPLAKYGDDGRDIRHKRHERNDEKMGTNLICREYGIPILPSYFSQCYISLFSPGSNAEAIKM
jgi:hypothetical protein